MLVETVALKVVPLEMEFCAVARQLVAAMRTYAKTLRLHGIIVAIVENENTVLALSSDGEWRIKNGDKMHLLMQESVAGLVRNYFLLVKGEHVDDCTFETCYPQWLAEFIEKLKAVHKDVSLRS